MHLYSASLFADPCLTSVKWAASFKWNFFTSSGGHLGNASWRCNKMTPFQCLPHLVHWNCSGIFCSQRLPLGPLSDLHTWIFTFALPFKELTNKFLRNDNQSTAIVLTPVPPSVRPQERQRSFLSRLRKARLLRLQVRDRLLPMLCTEHKHFSPKSLSICCLSAFPTSQAKVGGWLRMVNDLSATSFSPVLYKSYFKM